MTKLDSHASMHRPASFQELAREWLVAEWQHWLLNGFAVHVAEASYPASPRRDTAFWPALVSQVESLPDAIMAVVERVPGAVPTFARAVSGCLALWTPAQGTTMVLHLFDLARLARSPDLVEQLRRFLHNNNFASTSGEEVLAAAMGLIFSLANCDGSDRLLDIIRKTERLWLSTNAPLWLRARLRRDDRNWIAELCALEQDFKALGSDFDLARFLNRLLDDLPSLREIALSIEAYMTGGVGHMSKILPQGGLDVFGNPRPWFFDELFEGKRPILQIRYTNTWELYRIRYYGPLDNPLQLRSLGESEELPVRCSFWRKIQPCKLYNLAPSNVQDEKLVSDTFRSLAGFL